MLLDTDVFIRQLNEQISAHPNAAELTRVLTPAIVELRIADISNQNERIIPLLTELKEAIRVALTTSPAQPPIVIPGMPRANNRPDAPIDPFTDGILLGGTMEDVKIWINSSWQKRAETHEYFGFNKLKYIDGTRSNMPAPDQVMPNITPDKLALIKTLQKPILILTPTGVSLMEIATAFAKKRGAMNQNTMPGNWWNTTGNSDFDYDMRGELVYEDASTMRRTKMQHLLSPGTGYKGWRVLVVEGEDDTPRLNRTVRNVMENDRLVGYTGLTPEDQFMLQAEGIRMGKPFESNNKFGLLTGARLQRLDGIETTTPILTSRWYMSTSQLVFDRVSLTEVKKEIGSRPAVRLL